MSGIDNMTRSEMQNYILAGILEIERAGFKKTGSELRDDYRGAKNTAELIETSYDVEDCLRRIHEA